LTIDGLANAGGRKGGLGGIPPNGSLLVFKTSKTNKYGRLAEYLFHISVEGMHALSFKRQDSNFKRW